MALQEGRRGKGRQVVLKQVKSVEVTNRVILSPMVPLTEEEGCELP